MAKVYFLKQEEISKKNRARKRKKRLKKLLYVGLVLASLVPLLLIF